MRLCGLGAGTCVGGPRQVLPCERGYRKEVRTALCAGARSSHQPSGTASCEIDATSSSYPTLTFKHTWMLRKLRNDNMVAMHFPGM